VHDASSSVFKTDDTAAILAEKQGMSCSDSHPPDQENLR